MNAKTAFTGLAPALAIALLLAACGNKGPLVMPQKPVPVEQEMPAPPPAEQAPADEPAPATDPALQDALDGADETGDMGDDGDG